MSKHAICSPSGFKSVMLCVGKLAAERGMPDNAGKDARQGTAAHELAAMSLEDSVPPRAAIGEVIDVDGHEFIVDEEMADAVDVYYQLVRGLVQSTGGMLLVEQVLPIGHITGEAGAEGTGDAIIIAQGEIIVVDYKHGRGVAVDAHENPQLMLYGLGALERFGLAEDFERVRMIICQPRVMGEPITEYVLPAEELRRWGAEVATPIARQALYLYESQPADLPRFLTPAEDACRFCKAKAECPSLATTVTQALQAEFTDLTTASAAGQEDLVKQRVQPLDAGALGARLDAVPVIELWCKAIRAKAEAQLLSGQAVAGYKLVAGRRPPRAWSDPAKVTEALEAMRLRQDQIFERTLISPTTAEKLLKDKPKAWSKLAELITQPDGKPSVAPMADKRAAIQAAPTAEEFTNHAVVEALL